MDDFDPCALDLENQRLIQILIDKLIFLASSKNFTDEVDLLTKACLQTDIKMVAIFREDISNIFMYSCQIILNQNMCIVSGSGVSKDESLKIAVGKFLQYLFNQRNQSFPTGYSGNLFINDIVDSIKSTGIFENFIETSKELFSNQINRVNWKNDVVKNYENLKRELLRNANPVLILSESFHREDNNVTCTIFLNDSLILQQEVGENRAASLENATKEMFFSYALIPNTNDLNGNVIHSDKRKVIIQNMANKFEENKISSENHWATIQKCVSDLNYLLHLKYHNQECSVIINDFEILKASGDTEYCAQIQACKDLLKLFSQELRKKHIPMPNGCKNREAKLGNDLEEKIKSVVLRIHPLIETSESKTVWSILNEELLKEAIKFELKYIPIDNGIMCNYMYNLVKIVDGEGDNRSSSREEAAKKLMNKFIGDFENLSI